MLLPQVLVGLMFVLEGYSKKSLKHFKTRSSNHNQTAIVAISDILKSIPVDYSAIVYDKSVDASFINNISRYFHNATISTQIFYVGNPEGEDIFFEFLSAEVEVYSRVTTLFFCHRRTMENILLELYSKNLIRRRLLYIFYWGQISVTRRFVRTMEEAMKIVVITNPRPNAYRVYYNQATAHRRHNLKLVNWWILDRGLYQRPTLPSPIKIYKDFKGKIFQVPVVHKPPWHFVKYDNNSNVKVEGGRDDKLLTVIANKLNFRFQYFDPPDRSQGSSVLTNGTFQGVLGLIWQRESDFFLGDVAITLERSLAVEFSFLTLADSGAFVTHAPGKLNEALALVRPFQWDVWPLVVLTVVVSGPIMYALIAAPVLWQKRHRSQLLPKNKLLNDCVWFTTTIFLRQTGKTPDRGFRARFFTIILSIAATYVIGDMYSANLTSLLARPGREKPISTLSELEKAMKYNEYELYVERHSSSYTILENGTGIYGRLWELMQNQKQYLINSVETGVKMVRDSKKIAVIAGRETIFFDSRRFGASHFHLSEKLYTGYSAIAFQNGCPYIENFNKILIQLFEAGILTKMTEEEYEKLGKKQRTPDDLDEQPEPVTSNSETASNQGSATPAAATKAPSARAAAVIEEERKLEPISLAMLQGAFYILLLGYFFSGLFLALEIAVKKRKKRVRKPLRCLVVMDGFLKEFHVKFYKKSKFKVVDWSRRKLQEAIEEVAFDDLEYLD